MKKKEIARFIGLKIRELRMAYNLSQPELAHRIGVSQTTLCNIESGGTKKIDFLLIDKICTEFQVDFYYFIKDRKANSFMINEEQKINSSSANIANNNSENIIKQLKMLIDNIEQKKV